MFKKILIANRGEIACRIIRTCKNLDIKTVAIYSEADQNALHVTEADEAYLVGAADPQESYLNLSKIIEIAKYSKSEAIHPGYGFLSENPLLARACQEHGIRFIGPTAEVMEKMGDKIKARKLAKKAGLPVLPGTDQPVENDQAINCAWTLGFPLMVKAADGGGGIGIHQVENMDDLLPIVDRTRRVSNHAFSSTRLFFERQLKDASHIEVQLIGDELGNLIHLFDRDCSIQRRHQKLVEEAPSLKLTPAIKKKLYKLAVKLGNSIGYTNAGTVEFLVTAQGQIYFLEMNTRLQVEHGVTELVTGLDIVELQLKVAAGESLGLQQDDINLKGHAIQARVYPEDPVTFMPNLGKITDVNLPCGKNVRIDTAIGNNYEVTLHYEPLLGKVLSWGTNREEATHRLETALLELRINGITCNAELLRKILKYPEFVKSVHHTGTLAQLLNEPLNQRKYKNSDQTMGHSNKAQSNAKVAAAIGTAVALSLKNSASTASRPPSSWRSHGLQEQMLSHPIGSRGWR